MTGYFTDVLSRIAFRGSENGYYRFVDKTVLSRNMTEKGGITRKAFELFTETEINILSHISIASRPETRITLIPPSPMGVEIAATVLSDTVSPLFTF